MQKHVGIAITHQQDDDHDHHGSDKQQQHHSKKRSISPLSRIEQCIENMVPLNDADFDIDAQSIQNEMRNSDGNTNVIPSSFCADPNHLHSFTQLSSISSMLKSKFYTCQICNQRTSSFYDSTNVLLNCLACGLHIHRACLLRFKMQSTRCQSSTSSSESSFNSTRLLQICPINQEILQQREAFLFKHRIRRRTNHDQKSPEETSQNKNIAYPLETSLPIEDNSNSSEKHVMIQPEYEIDKVVEQFCSKKTRTLPSPKNIMHDDGEEEQNNSSDEDSEDDYIWSQDGPSQHWALSSPQVLHGIKTNNILDDHQEVESNQDEKEKKDGNFKATFLNLSKALQENLLIHVMKRQEDEEENDDDNAIEEQEQKKLSLSDSANKGDDDIVDDCQTIYISNNVCNDTSQMNYPRDNDRIMDDSKTVVQAIARQINTHDFETNRELNHPIEPIEASIDSKDLIKRQKPIEVPTMKLKAKANIEMVSSTVEIVKKTQSTGKAIGLASFAGTIAGGAVGLVVAGPAGAFLGGRIGQFAAGAGVLIEGSWRIGVLVAGVKGTLFTVNQLQGGMDGQSKNRVLTMGEKGSECKVVLVRPNVVVDPEWESIVSKIRVIAPHEDESTMFASLNFLSLNKVREKQGRQKRDSTIANSTEHEMSMKEKIFLLVSSSLNDKNSLPGFVYRSLIEEVKQRAKNRQQDVPDDKNGVKLTGRCERQDVHAIIKYITATLLEVRPGLVSSARITELAATAVETFVFGEVYDLVFDEIVHESREKDQALSEKLRSAHICISSADFISDEAIKAFKSLQEQHSVSEKLASCVNILESISMYGERINMCADSLLKMVCQHIVFANVSHLNAECLFLEEFAKDEQLLRGREGYALVTLQASLHFLHVCPDLKSDIFEDI